MYRFLSTLTAAAAILTAASLMPNGAAAIPLNGKADIAAALEQNDPGLYQCQFGDAYGQDFRERLERFRHEREERRERLERERAERRERFERERRERRERFEHERRERREHREH